MISHKHRFIIIHQRKCAGMALARALNFDPKSRDFATFNDGTLSDNELFDHWNNHPDWVQEYHITAVCRNPWDRFVSGWRYSAKTRDIPLLKLLRNIRDGAFEVDANLHAHLTRPQVEILTDRNGEFVPDSMIRFEHLQKNFDVFCDQVGYPRQHISRTNSSDRKPYWAYYNDEARDLITEIFNRDINQFDYQFEKPASAWARSRERAATESRRLFRRIFLSRFGRFLSGGKTKDYDYW